MYLQQSWFIYCIRDGSLKRKIDGVLMQSIFEMSSDLTSFVRLNFTVNLNILSITKIR